MLKRLIRGCLVVVVAVGGLAHAQIATQLNALTGSLRTRIVWLQGGNQLDGGGALMGYDSQDDATRQILAASTNQNRPILCSGGYRIVITRNYVVYVLNWDGTGLRQVTNGICTDVWVDPTTGLEWAVVRLGQRSIYGNVRRYLIDDPSQSVLLWSNTPAGDYYMDWYQISADGRLAVDFLPWDRASAVDSGGWVSNGFSTNPVPARGCWSSLACDNSYYWAHLPLTGIGHSGLNIYRRADTVRTQVPITAPKHGGTYYHPKFVSGSIANGGRFIVLTNNDGDSIPSEVCFGKFNANYTGFDGWVQVTSNTVADITPDAWVGVAAPSPSMRFSADSLAFTAAQGGANPAVQRDTVTTPYGTLSNVTVSDNAAWLTVSVAQSGSAWVVTNTVNVSGLASGVYRATVTVQATNAVPPLRTYGVKLTVTGTPVASFITVTPASAMVAKQGTLRLTATVYSQMEQPMSPQPAVSWSVLAPANGVTVNAGTVTAGTVSGIVRVVASSGGLADTAEVNVVDFIPVHIKLNCGDRGPGYVPGWEGDQQYAVPPDTGKWFPDDQGWTIDMSAVQNPPPRDVYVRFRSGTVRYNFPSEQVPAGAYRVRLHFWEPYSSESRNPRAINCTIEGATVMTGMRILTEAGGVLCKAIVKEYDVTVNGDGMQMLLSGTSPLIIGMEIISSGSLAKQITLLEPLGGGHYLVGDALTVRWSALASVNSVVVEISPDGGDHWGLIVPNAIKPTDAQWGAYRWTITPTVQETNGSLVLSTVSSNVLVRVRDYTQTSWLDASSAPMVIEPPVGVRGTLTAAGLGAPVVRRHADGLTVSVPWPGAHVVEVFGLAGRRLAAVQSSTPGTHTLGGGPAASGSVVVRVRGARGETVEQVIGAR